LKCFESSESDLAAQTTQKTYRLYLPLRSKLSHFNHHFLYFKAL